MVGKNSESEVADHLYELILELHAIDSSVLLAVMPQLEFKLKVRVTSSPGSWEVGSGCLLFCRASRLRSDLKSPSFSPRCFHQGCPS